MYRGAMRGVCRFSYCFRERRMRVNRPNERLDGGFQPQRECGLRHQLGCAPPDHVNAEHLIVLRVGDDLDESLGFARHLRAAEYAKRESANTHVEAALLRLALGKPDTADLGIAIRAGGHMI